MGYMRHHAIVVTSWDSDILEEAHAKAREIFPYVSPISPPATNGYAAFFIPPDGSKEGWPASDDGDDRRNKFIAWLNEQRFPDGSTVLDWVEVQFGDENGESKVCRHSDDIVIQ